MKYCIFKNNKYTGLYYTELNDSIKEFHKEDLIIAFETEPLFKRDKDGTVTEAYELTADEQLAVVKENKLSDLTEYDESDAVNSFTVDGESAWLDRSTRLALSDRLGRTTGTLKITFGELSVDLEVAVAASMLTAIGTYADGCFDNTQVHSAAIKALSTVGEIEAYDFTSGYPEKLSF